MSIHPTALVDPGAQLDSTVEVGPYAIIGAETRIGARTRIGAFCCIHPGVEMGADNEVHTHACIGDKPQHLAYDGGPRRTVIGNHNILREGVTIHRPFHADGETRIGDHCLLMVNSHVGHDSLLHDRVVLTNGALIAGHVTIEDNVIVSGNAGIHQFVRIGRFAMIQGCSALTKDLTPFVLMNRVNRVCGINVVGLRRAGFDAAARQAIKHAYKILFRQGHSVPRALQILRDSSPGPEVQELIAFVEQSKRGICIHAGGDE